MSEIISVTDLSKVYDIYNNPSDRVKELFSFNRKRYSYQHTALREITFSIDEGEFVGVVGKNGAGKSTLLKILSGHLSPTQGALSVKGSVSLLQLGVGFNNELSGIENIRFSSKLLGHDDRKVDEIIEKVIEFAEIGDFIHHPVKTYSSGMYSRLAFAIGITVDPDILIVDEVLSVGDMQFASKCMNRMHELKETGKTVIIVTHDVEKVAVFCNRAIWLKDASIESIGNAREVIEKYRDYMWTWSKSKSIRHEPASTPSENILAQEDKTELLSQDIDWLDLRHHDSFDTGCSRITHAAVYKKASLNKSSLFSRGEILLLYLKIHSNRDIPEIVIGWNLIDKKGLIAVHSGSNFCSNNIKNLKADQEITCCFEFVFPPLKNSEYIFSLGIRELDKITFKINNVLPIQIFSDDFNSQQGGYVILEQSNFYY